ncbi:MAG: hypothetical protein MOB07_08180 [Acidobacteria bacterium]|nr:hypothetical protein [Acidobacteriota bacterium]
MKFFTDIGRGGDVDPEDIKRRLNEYNDYLQSIQESLPPAVYAFATAPWHYDDGACGLHDSWLESLSISELASGERSQYRTLEIRVRLLSAYHNRHIELIYEGVRNYYLETSSEFKSPPNYKTGHGDWLIDEIRLSERNLVLHEIEFSSGSHWIIECEDIQYRSEPKLRREPLGEKADVPD